PVADRPESQDLCFLSGTNVDAFLGANEAGAIVDLRGRVLGEHDGQHRFTVGQRRGIGVAGPEPLYVIRKDRGRVVVGPREALATRSVSVAGAILLRDGAEVDRVKLRSPPGPAGA